MGFFGRSKPRDDWDAISTLIKACEKLFARREIVPSRRAGIIFRPADVPFLNELKTRLGPILHEGEGATKTGFDLVDDAHGTRWVVLDDGNFPDLVSSVYTVGNAIQANGAKEHRLAAVFEFYPGANLAAVTEARDWKPGSAGYFIYSYLRQAYYPFIPQGKDKEGKDQRDRPAELSMGALMRHAGIATDRHLENWYALWGIPF
ncbi:MAG: hypothetical protein FJ314_00185 [SAR202 cluster bacterium]|nr:hypothetical protein [SAR202 cluster bacterium]